MAGKLWKTTSPPKRRVRKPVRIRYRSNDGGHFSVGDFFWSARENAWVECIAGPDGIALYADLYTVVAWR